MAAARPRRETTRPERDLHARNTHAVTLPLPGLGGPCGAREHEWDAEVGDVLVARCCVRPDGHAGDHDYGWVEVGIIDRTDVEHDVETVHVAGGVL